MNKYIITADDTADLPASFYEQHEVPLLHLSYVVNDIEYDGVTSALTIAEFYDKIRNGAMPYTQQVNPESARCLFERLVKEGYDILHIAFSSGLSGTYNSARMGALEVQETYPDAKITVIDSLCASMGEGLLLHEVVARKEAGMEYDTLVNWVEENKLRLVHEVVADDLNHLHRGGRLSKVSAILGTALSVKPIIHVNDEGKLINIAKQRHKGMALKFIANRLADRIETEDGLDTIGISHSDCIDDVNRLVELIKEKTGIEKFIISDIGPVIGSHTGIGTLAVFYFAKGRQV
ncbi:MAG: DegV family protein [Lachnospiraceae bacterium]